MTRRMCLLVLAVLAVVACGATSAVDSGTRVADPTPSTDADSPATADPDDTTGATETTTGPAASAASVSAPLSGAVLASAVLALADLPAGWERSDDGTDLDQDDDGCMGQDPFTLLTPLAKASSSFQKTDFGPFAVSSAWRYAAADVPGLLHRIEAAIRACGTYAESDENGSETTSDLTIQPFPELADGTLAARVSSETEVGPLALDIVYVVVDDLLLAIGQGGFVDGPDPAFTEQLVRTVVDRL